VRTATRERLVIIAFLAALALPIAYSLFVRDGWLPRGWFLGTVVAIWLVQFVRDRRMLGRHSGDERKGLTIFVEPVAWTGLKWAYRSFYAATQAVGLEDRIEMFEWSSFGGAVLVVPDLLRLKRNLGCAARLSDRIAAHVAQYPDSPVHMATYSSGGFIALEALRRLPPGTRVRSLLIQTATVSRDYDLAAALAACDEIVNVWSPLDWPVNGFGALVFGTNDRRHAVPAGTLPFRTPREDGGGTLQQIRWQPAFMRYGYFGEHFTALALPWTTHLLAAQRRRQATGGAMVMSRGRG
jgi:hypothetical protein